MGYLTISTQKKSKSKVASRGQNGNIEAYRRVSNFAQVVGDTNESQSSLISKMLKSSLNKNNKLGKTAELLPKMIAKKN